MIFGRPLALSTEGLTLLTQISFTDRVMCCCCCCCCCFVVVFFFWGGGGGGGAEEMLSIVFLHS